MIKHTILSRIKKVELLVKKNVIVGPDEYDPVLSRGTQYKWSCLGSLRKKRSGPARSSARAIPSSLYICSSF